MNSSKVVRAAVAVVGAIGLGIAGTQTASADSSHKLYIDGHMAGWGAFQSYGEIFSAYDNWPDGKSIVVEWTASTKSSYYYCWDSNGAANGPSNCNDSIAEGARVTWRVCTADRPTLRICSGWLVDYA